MMIIIINQYYKLDYHFSHMLQDSERPNKVIFPSLVQLVYGLAKSGYTYEVNDELDENQLEDEGVQNSDINNEDIQQDDVDNDESMSSNVNENEGNEEDVEDDYEEEGIDFKQIIRELLISMQRDARIPRLKTENVIRLAWAIVYFKAQDTDAEFWQQFIYTVSNESLDNVSQELKEKLYETIQNPQVSPSIPDNMKIVVQNLMENTVQ
eukprot:TRINITY_DN9071_c0_g1_i6.p1 TRINITY_DN9071_c0_g1~~TRINITY_DN9071_c0_g1_i6.p1  ORF type:complete len:217 (-),score=35.00 TRINITY_DN9071_c0_g1_i6:265-891(-)